MLFTSTSSAPITSARWLPGSTFTLWVGSLRGPFWLCLSWVPGSVPTSW